MFSLAPTMAQQTTKLSIIPSTTSAQVGSNFTVNLEVSNVQDLGGWNLNLTWNPQVINLTQVTEGPFLASVGSTMFTWSPSMSPISRSLGFLPGVADVLLQATGASGSGVLATITFHVLRSGTSPISIDGTQLIGPASVDNQIPATLTNGIVNVGGSSSSSTPASSTTPPPSTTSTPTPHPSNDDLGSPTQSPDSPQAPEFPTLLVVLPSIFLASAASLLLLKKAKTGQSK